MKKQPEIYCGKDEEWYWRFRAKNNKIIADGSQGYNTRSGARRAFKRLETEILKNSDWLKVRE